ncbi:MAG: hypothetical protein GY941_15570 [Planctomycetes bacterium]|nr:hypothetical protein [Planctomycetota bacterium]
MTKRMSSKERIRQKADEATAGEEVKSKASVKKKSATGGTKVSTTLKRQKMVWKVFDEAYKEITSFPYVEKAEADAKAEDLSKKKNQNFLVRAIKVPMEE